MQELLSGLFEEAKKNKDILIHLKNLSVRTKQYELASQLRDLETSLFPESQEEKDAKEIQNALAMVDLQVQLETCWLIAQTLKVHQKKKGNFSLKDAAQLLAKKNQIFSSNQ